MEIILVKSYNDKPWRSPETYQLIENCLKEKWTVHSIAAEDATSFIGSLTRLREVLGSQIFVFNIAEYIDEVSKEGFIPGLLDQLKIPHLGSNAATIQIGLNKALTKKILIGHQIPTPSYFVGHHGDPSLRQKAEEIGYPLFVKPLEEGGHLGITEESIVNNEQELEMAVLTVFSKFNQPALVEKFIMGHDMREFSVGIVDGKNRLITPIEIDFQAMQVKTSILSHEAAVKDLEKIKRVEDDATRIRVVELAVKAYEAVGCRDYGRVDIRKDETGTYVLEINVMPGMGPHSFLPEAAQDIYGLRYCDLIQTLTEASILRNPMNGIGRLYQRSA